MKKNYLFKFTLLLIPVIGFSLISFTGGVGGDRSGSPGDGGTTCTVCHAPGANFGAVAMITSNIPANGYEFDTDYTVTVSVTSSAAGHGFQATAERISDNANVGTFSATDGNTLVQDNGARISHANKNNSTWSFTWRSPSTNQGTIRFYTAVNAVNNNGQNSGDQVVTATSEPRFSLGISEANLLKFEMFPNPSPNEINIQLPTGTAKANAQVFDYTGKLVQSKSITSVNNKVDVSSLSKGIYIVRVSADGKLGAQKFVKN